MAPLGGGAQSEVARLGLVGVQLRSQIGRVQRAERAALLRGQLLAVALPRLPLRCLERQRLLVKGGSRAVSTAAAARRAAASDEAKSEDSSARLDAALPERPAVDIALPRVGVGDAVPRALVDDLLVCHWLAVSS